MKRRARQFIVGARSPNNRPHTVRVIDRRQINDRPVSTGRFTLDCSDNRWAKRRRASKNLIRRRSPFFSNALLKQLRLLRIL